MGGESCLINSILITSSTDNLLELSSSPFSALRILFGVRDKAKQLRHVKNFVVSVLLHRLTGKYIRNNFVWTLYMSFQCNPTILRSLKLVFSHKQKTKIIMTIHIFLHFFFLTLKIISLVHMVYNRCLIKIERKHTRKARQGL